MQETNAFFTNDTKSLPPPYSALDAPPISTQPGQYDLQAQQPTATYPPVLENLAKTGSIRFKQEVQIVQLICGCDMPINFDMIDEFDRIIYQIKDEENFCVRNCIPQGFRTDFSMSKTNGEQALLLKRETRCVLNICMPCCCFKMPFSKEELTVSSGTGVIYGSIQRDWSTQKAQFSVLNEKGSVMLKIEGPVSGIGFFEDIRYKIVNLDGEEVGCIVKHWSGFLCEILGDFDNFTMYFPRDLDVHLKATLIGAVKLINFLYYQGSFRRIFVNGGIMTCFKTSMHP